MARAVTEWVNVTDDLSIIARESGEVWFHNLSGTNGRLDPFATPMGGAGSLGSTVGLLDGAINLAFSKIEKRLARPEPTLTAYIVALVGAYHTSVDTPRNLRRAASRFEELGRPEVAAYLEVRAREETGHDRLALKDLRALGVPGEQLVANFIPEGIKPLCKRFDDLCAEDYPIGSVGYSYCLERIAALKEKSDIENVQTLFADGVDATRFLRSHSSLGSEAAHVDETIEFVASLPANDRIKVVQETYQSALVMAEGYNHELLKSETQMREEIEQALGEALPDLRGRVFSDSQKRHAAAATAD
jgi:pyrroloquinoline quinone (PQQ) biosynthesis protein C